MASSVQASGAAKRNPPGVQLFLGPFAAEAKWHRRRLGAGLWGKSLRDARSLVHSWRAVSPWNQVAVALCSLSLRVVAFAGPHLPRRQLSLAAPITVLAGVLPAFPAAAASDGGAGFQAIMFAPVISLFAIIGVAMIGGFVLGIFVPPGEGDYGDFETTLGEREARERGWRRGVLRGYDEETYAAMRGQSKEWAQVDYPFAKPKPQPGRKTCHSCQAGQGMLLFVTVSPRSCEAERRRLRVRVRQGLLLRALLRALPLGLLGRHQARRPLARRPLGKGGFARRFRALMALSAKKASKIAFLEIELLLLSSTLGPVHASLRAAAVFSASRGRPTGFAQRFVKMGSALATDTIPVLVTMVDVHNAKSQDMFYFCNVGSGGAATKVIGRSQTLSVEVGITTVLTLIVYECPEPVFTPETARCLGVLRVPVERLAERYSSGIFQQWFNLDTKTDPRMPAGDLQSLVTKFEQSYADSVNDIYQPKVCLSVIGSSFEVQQGSRSTFGIFVGEDVKTQAGPDLKALIASHKQQAAYIDALHEELRRLNTPSYRPLAASMAQPIGPATPGSFAVPRQGPAFGSGYAFGAPVPSSMAPH
ncbi:unnamed protein product [Symbiodinium sp. CCMP2456]|nr:unnamed protein product [Symbiodinium sp. CCMP2456]